jgi:type III secretory pathway component EscR
MELPTQAAAVAAGQLGLAQYPPLLVMEVTAVLVSLFLKSPIHILVLFLLA